ncbi:MAG: TraR/DksA C4-type zinc finger protein [Pseudomonadota bacterium]
MSHIDEERVRSRLLALRAEICGLMAETQEDVRPVALDQTQQGRLSRMDAMQRQAMAQEARRRRAAEIERIDAALGRLDRGDYGYCARCEEPIAAPRLAHDPAAPLCLHCASGG